jgi:hypothetical protein
VTTRPKLRDALILVGLAALLGGVAIAWPAAATSLTTTVIDARESIGRYDQALGRQISVSASVRFVREHSPQRWTEAEMLATTIDAQLLSDPGIDRAHVLARISTAARAFAADGRRIVALLDGPGPNDDRVVAEVLRSGHRFESALDAYPLRWIDRVRYEPVLWLVVFAATVLAILAFVHASVWLTSRTSTWARRDRRRIHAQLFWRVLVTDGMIAVLVAVLMATHALDQNGPVFAVAALAAACLAAAVIEELRSREIIAVLKSHDRVPMRAEVRAAAPPGWLPSHVTINTHLLPTMPALPTEPMESDVLLLGDGLRGMRDESGTVRVVVEQVTHQ